MGIICCTKMLVMWSVFDLKKKEWCLLVILNSDFAFNLKLKAKSQLRITSGHHSFFSINVKLGEVLSMRRDRVKYDNVSDIDSVILIERFLNTSAYLDSVCAQ